MMKENRNPLTTNAVPTIPLPSADLIVYRFDQTDRRMDGLNLKVDDGFNSLGSKLDNMVHIFATKEELNEITKRLDNWQWYWRALISAVLIALATSIVSVIIVRR